MNLKTWAHLGWVPGCIVLLGLIGQTVSTETRVVCYYTNWSVYRPGTAKFSPQNINPYLCTHLIYAFGGFTKENSLKPFDKYQDIEKGGYAKFTGLKTYNKNLKTMLAIGGWNEGSSRFSPMVANAERRKELVRNSIKFLRQNHFDGLDLDWEYPSFRDGGKARDRDNYAQLVQELREEFDRESEKTGRPRLLLTMAVPAGIEYINKGYDVPKLNKYLDWMNILSYDYHSAFEPAVNHHSPLFPIEEDDEYNYDGDLNIDHTIKHYLKAGAEPNKLVLGIPTYGRSYTLFNPDANELGAPADGPGDMGDATRENGYLAYYEICENLKENHWQIVQPNPDAMGPYAFKDNQWVSYDDELIVRKKSEYVVEHGLGGIMFWSIDNDDFRGNCNNKPYPLIEAAKDALLTAASGKTDDNLVSAPSKTRKPITRTRTRPSSTADNSIATSRVQNSGGRQTFEDTPSASSGRKRVRPGTRTKSRSEDAQEETKISRPTNRQRSTGRRRKTTTTAAPTTRISTTPSTPTTTPSWKTPEPPTTPDPGGDFKCEEDGFFQHPRDCKKYFWCLSGPADLGIIAHQFTCPAGLYFNKGADSCDYSQNVPCNKKSKATTTTTSTTTSTTPAPTFSTTTRRVSRITAATSRTTFAHTTTTTEEPEYYDEYEYDDDDFEESPKHGIDPEEDPRVIKELVDLIKKVGGIEELEKYLKVQEDGTMGVTATDLTTPATISRSLYDRVLSRANVKSNSYKPNSYKPNSYKSNTTATTTSRGGLTYSTLNRNRGPQSQTLEKSEASTRSRGPQGGEKSETSENAPKGKPQYTTISRNRPSVEKTVDESEEDESEDDDDEDQIFKTRQFISRQQQNQPEYVTIRRQRPSAATDFEEETTTRSTFRSRQRGVPGEDVVDEVTETSGTGYVTVQRPSSEDTTTSKYTTILRRRPATESTDDSEESADKEIIQRRPQAETKDETETSESPRRRSSTEAPEVTTEEKLHRSTTLDTTTVLEVATEKSESLLEKDSNQLSSDDIKVNIEETTVKEEVDQTTIQESKVTTIQGTTIQSEDSKVTTIQDSTDSITEIPTDATNQISDSSANSDIVSEVAESTSEKITPTLFRPRPFASRGRPTTPKSTEVVTKVGETTKSGTAVRPFVRKFPPGGNRFNLRDQSNNTQIEIQNTTQTTSQKTLPNSSKYATINRASITKTDKSFSGKTSDNKTPESKLEDNGVNTEEVTTDRSERIRNRGKSRFRLATTTSVPFTRRRTATADYEYEDEEQPHRTYRPTILADLSSLTSADISFRGGSNRKHIRRRPSTSTTENPTETTYKTGPRSLTLARKKIGESNFGRADIVRNTTTEETLKTEPRTLALARQKFGATDSGRTSRRVTKTNETGINAIDETTKTASQIRPRPAYSTLLRTTTTKSIEQIETSSEVTTTTLPTPQEINEVTDASDLTTPVSTDINNTKSETIFDVVTTEVNLTDTTEFNTTMQSSDGDLISEGTTLRNRAAQFSTTERIRRTRPTISSASVTPDIQKPLNRTRKVIISNRRRTTASPIEDTISTSSVNIPDIKRPRPSYLSLRNNQNITRPNITRLRPVNNTEDASTSSETTRSYVRRIRPITLAPRVDGEEQIKLSETNISENDYLGTVRNLPEDDTGKYRRRKIIKRIRPGKDTEYSKSEADGDIKTKSIRIGGKTTEEVSNKNSEFDDLEEDPKLRKETFAKSESSDILRSKRIRTSDNDDENGFESIQTSKNRIRINSETTTQIDDSTDSKLEDTTVQQVQKVTTNRNRNIIRKFRPGQETQLDTDTKIKSFVGNSKLFETSKIGNRTRKIIRRLRPVSTTTEIEVLTSEFPSTTTEYFSSTTEEIETPESVAIPIATTEENITENGTLEIRTLDDDILETNTYITSTSENNTPESESPDVQTEEGILTTEEIATPEGNLQISTENNAILEPLNAQPQEVLSELPEDQTEFALTTLDDSETTQFTTEQEITTTTTTTPRPTRPSLIGRSRPAYRPRNRPLGEIRTTTSPIIRRRLNPLQRNESRGSEVEDDRLKKYNKKYSPIARTTTERARVLQDEITTEKITTTAVNTEGNVISQDAKTEEVIVEVENGTTEVSEASKIPEVTEDIEKVSSTTESVLDTTIIDEISTIFLPEIITMNIEPQETEMPTTQNDLTTLPEDIITIFTTERISTTTDLKTNPTTTSLTTESLTTELTSSTTDSKVTDSELETTEFLTDIPEIYQVQTDSTSNDTITESDGKSDQDRTYKPIRYKPSDRPKLVINLNRTETLTSDKQEIEDQKSKKFTPSRTVGQRNRSRLAYRTSTEKPKVTEETDTVPEQELIPTGRRIEQPKISTNTEDDKPGRGFYPTLKPSDLFVNRYDNQHQNPDELEDDEDFDDDSEEEPLVVNPLIKYLKTVRTQQEDPNVEDNIDEEDEQVEEPDEYEDEIEEDNSNIPYSNIPRYNIPLPKPTSPSVPNQNIPNRVSNRPQFNRPAASNVPRRPESISEARPVNEPRRPETRRPEPNRPNTEVNRPAYESERSDLNRSDLNRTATEARQNEPRRSEPNRPLGEPNRPAIPRSGPARNYPRKFNKPIYSSTTSTTERLSGIDLEAVNARNKNLFNKNRKMNVPLAIPPTAENITESPVETTSITVQLTEEITSIEPTTEQPSTLHHIFAEPDIPKLETTTVSMETTTYNLTAAQLEAARSLERVIEVNRIVEVSFKDDSSAGSGESRVMLDRVPTLDRIGAINRLTVIKIVDGGNETNATFPSNHAVTLNEIVTGRRIETGRKVNLEAQLHAPDIHQTKMTIFNNTIEIIESLRSAEDVTSQEVLPHEVPLQEVTTAEVSSTEKSSTADITTLESSLEVTTSKIDFTTVSDASNEVQAFEETSPTTVATLDIVSAVVNQTTTTDPFLDQVNHKFEIYSKSNVVNYSHRDPIEIIANAQLSERPLDKEGRKLAIESKSVVANNNHPVFNDGTALPIEVLFQTDYNRESSTLPTLKDVVTGKGNLVDDDQDLLESQHGRVRIRILGQDAQYDTKYEIHEKPVLIPIRLLNEEPKTERAEVVEITPSPQNGVIKIAPIEVAVAQRVPIVRVESSVSQEGDLESSVSQEGNLESAVSQESNPNARLYGGPFNGEVIFGESKS